jgi:hypothetical protein
MFAGEALKRVCGRLVAMGFTREEINEMLPAMVAIVNRWLAGQRFAAPPGATLH